MARYYRRRRNYLKRDVYQLKKQVKSLHGTLNIYMDILLRRQRDEQTRRMFGSRRYLR